MRNACVLHGCGVLMSGNRNFRSGILRMIVHSAVALGFVYCICSLHDIRTVDSMGRT